ncbi:MAG TPA: Uma2 family endonuclease [Gammaproteobacteria bacterium]|nr:Uma2 family endonuclease [Gammaproteobacteria bacterium]
MVLPYQEYYTYEDYQQWQGDWELIEGMPYAMTPSPSVTHQTVATNLVAEIKANANNPDSAYSHCHVLMETDWQISNDTVVRPDVMVICQDIDERVVVTPELIVEVVSSSSTKRDEVMKFDLYQREGVLYYVLAYPEKRLARIYKNLGNSFVKQGDLSTQTFRFAIQECSFVVDFSSIWRK